MNFELLGAGALIVLIGILWLEVRKASDEEKE